MADLLPLSRAARLVGVTRGALQKRIKNGELRTFEGMVRVDDLTRVFPDAAVEESAVLERVSRIREQAFGKRVRDRLLPDAEVLAARLTELGREQAQTRSQLELYKKLVMGLDRGLAELAVTSGDPAAGIRRLKNWLASELENGLHKAGLPPSILAHDSLLRLVSAHVQLLPSGHEFFVEGDDSLLDAGLRAGLLLPYGCSDGSCGQCRARLVSGQVRSQQETGETGTSDGVLLCRCTAVTDTVLEIAEAVTPTDVASRHLDASVRGKELSPAGVVILQLRSDSPHRLRFLSGQSVTLSLENGLRREVPLASCPCDAHSLEFHLADDGAPFNQYVARELRIGDRVGLTGPSGGFVLDVDSDRGLVFIALETGFAAIKSMIEHALALEHTDRITLYWLAHSSAGHYRDNLCRAWADALDFFDYRPLVLAEGADLAALFTPGDVEMISAQEIYIAGPRAGVNAVRDGLRGSAVPRAQIHTLECP